MTFFFFISHHWVNVWNDFESFSYKSPNKLKSRKRKALNFTWLEVQEIYYTSTVTLRGEVRKSCLENKCPESDKRQKNIAHLWSIFTCITRAATKWKKEMKPTILASEAEKHLHCRSPWKIINELMSRMLVKTKQISSRFSSPMTIYIQCCNGCPSQ